MNATRLPERHRHRVCSFNDDVQGTVRPIAELHDRDRDTLGRCSLAEVVRRVRPHAPAAGTGPAAPLLPPISDSRRVARHVALAVTRAAVADGVVHRPGDVERRLDERTWVAEYRPIDDGFGAAPTGG